MRKTCSSRLGNWHGVVRVVPLFKIISQLSLLTIITPVSQLMSLMYHHHWNIHAASSPPTTDIISEIEVFRILDHLHHTSTSLDNIPASFLRLGAAVFSRPPAYLFSRSISTATVPHQWKRAFIVPIAKVSCTTTPSDYRPISIMPVLSQALEKHIVRTYIYPAILQPLFTLDFSDQYGFQPTGSTTAALVTLFHTITVMLDSNPLVRVIALDFSKAFDTVRHLTLLEKLTMLNLPDGVYNWLNN